MSKCSQCNIEITNKFCPNCGQKYIDRRVTLSGIIADLGDAIFSVDKSFWLNMRIMLIKPEFIIRNFWSGYRNYFFNPGRFLIISALILGLNLILFDNRFLGLKITAVKFSAQLLFPLLLIPFLSIISYLTYIKFKKNFLEHLVMNTYTTSFFLIVFTVLSVIIELADLTFLITPARITFFASIFLWNSRVFELTLSKRILYVFINTFLFFLPVILFIYSAISNVK